MSRARSAAIFTLIALVLGCSGGQLPPVDPFAKAGVGKSPAALDEATIGRFELNREQAEYRAALACWQREDTRGCQNRLNALLARNPQHQQAVGLKSHLLAAEGHQTPIAEKPQGHLAVRPEDAAAQLDGQQTLDQENNAVGYFSSGPQEKR